MSEKPKKNAKGKKCDGMSKKERRALKVAEMGGSNKASNTQLPADTVGKKETKSAHKIVTESTVNSTKTLQAKNVKENNIAAVATSNTRKNEASQNDTSKNTVMNDQNASKAQLKADRRTLQDKQRLAKTSTTKTPAPTTKPPPKLKPPSHNQHQSSSPNHRHQVPLFNHLYNDICSHAATCPDSSSIIVSPAGVHPAFARLSVQYATRTVIGSNARCIALLAALKQLVIDHVTPPKQDLCRSLEHALQVSVDYLQNNSRKLSVSMSNALRHFKLRMTQIETNVDDSAKKTQLLSCIDSFLTDDIGKAGEAISIRVRDKIMDGDVILTYGCSSLIQRILLDTHASKRNSFHCIVVDSRPLLEGRHTLRILAQAGIPCTYTLINGTCSIIGRATKVLLGAHALFANGGVMARTGTAQVAMVASRSNKPVMVCCETYKFCERAQVDSYVYNELGEPDALARLDTPLRKWTDIPCLTPLNLMYDVTPPDYVTAVVTELGMLPCTSVPVILRVKQDIA